MKQLAEFFPSDSTSHNQKIIGQLQDFIDDDNRVFILKGYAGTGKTTMMKAFIDYLQSVKRQYVLMASTGRASKVLEEKVLQKAATIHSTIYNIESVDNDDDTRLVRFKLKQNTDHKQTIYIIDEASMITDKPSLNQHLQYGDGRLLAHIFRYTDDKKILFIGDPAQLPPVKNKFSAALVSSYLQMNFNVKVVSVELTKVWRQANDSGILYNATHLRFPEMENPVLTNIRTSGFNDIEVLYQQTEMVRKYVSLVHQHGLESTIIITLSNKEVNRLNQQVRRYLFPAQTTITSGEWLMIVFNSYAYNLVNGQHAKLIEISPHIEKRANLTFRNVTIEVDQMGKKRLVNCKIIEDLLYVPAPYLSVEQQNEMMKDFAIRMRKQGIKPGTLQYEEMFLTDPYLNAIRVKFGYAVTCHKAQGGEWPNVILQLEYAITYFDPENAIRWIYTAITRASEKLYILKNKHVI